MSLYIDPASSSSDPLYFRRGRPGPDGGTQLDLYPHELIRAHPPQAAAWARRLDLFGDPGPLNLHADAAGRAELVLDLGTELEAEFELRCQSPCPITLCITFGESVPEAEGWGVQGQHPVPTIYWHLPTAGHHGQRVPSRGFRFVRIAIHDLRGTLKIEKLVAHAWFAYRTRRGDFHCSDPLLQRVWQASAYTARLCSRPAAYWDGIKRDRLGWYGDARITQETADLTFHDPAQAAGMLANLATNEWANEIPGYSFDAVAMLRQLILAHGTGLPALPDMYAKMRDLLAWTRRQTDSRGLLVRQDDSAYFFNIGFLDWAQTPVGGRFEELSWLQCKYLDALQNAAAIAGFLRRPAEAQRYAADAQRLAAVIQRLFWQPRQGFLHTLNQVSRQWKKPDPHEHYHKTYLDKVRLGPSGPSRHSSALATLAGLCTTEAQRRAVLRTLDNPKIPAIITGYFAYYENLARGLCGDRTGALLHLRDTIGAQLLFDDSPTVSEYYEPEIRDFRRWSLHGFPKSMCHGWSSGMVPITARCLLGIQPVAPGFAQVIIDPLRDWPGSYEARVPTPHGPIHVRQDRPGAIEFDVPKGVAVLPAPSTR
jgi:hypothetical protein